MYHIKNDKRAEKSVDLICSGLLKCLKEKPFAEITVTDIQKVSTVSRSTFYRNFDRITDVLELLCDRGFENIFGAYTTCSFGSLKGQVFDYWFNNSAILEVLVNINRTDIFFNSFRRSALKLDSLRFLAENMDKFDYFVSIISSVMMGVLITWIEHGKAETRDQLRAVIQDEFSAISALGIMG